MSSERELDEGIKSIKSAWQREHTARANLEKMLQQAETENAKLRELAVLQSVIFKHMSICPTTVCQACPVGEECAESVHLEGVLGIDDKETSWLVQWRSEDAADVRAENAKLRELCEDIYKRFRGVVFECWAYSSEDFRMYEQRMRELGIEVD